MINTASVALRGVRTNALVVPINFVGIDLTSATVTAVVLQDWDNNPADPEIALTETPNGNGSGVVVGTITTSGGVTTSPVTLTIGAADMAAIPAAPEVGSDLRRVWYLMIQTDAGDANTKRRYLEGYFYVGGSASGTGGTGSVTATIVNDTIAITVDGASAIGPLVEAAEAAASAAEASADEASGYADEVAGFTQRRDGFGQDRVMTDLGQTADELSVRVLSSYSKRQNALVSASFLSEKEIANLRVVNGVGHSGIEGSGSTFSPNSDPYEQATSGQTAPIMGRIKALLGADWRVYNNGIGAQGADAIAARFGAVPTFITVSGGSIPSTGAVNCTLTNQWLENAGGRGFSIPATINGVSVLIKAPTNGGATPQHTVEQYPSTGSSVAVSAKTRIIPSNGDLDYGINLFYIDRNGQDIDKMKYLTGQLANKVKGQKRFVFIGTWNWRSSGGPSGEIIGTAGYNTTIAINDAYQMMWPDNFFDKRKFLRGDYPYNGSLEPSPWDLTGLSPSAQDLTDIANGLEPTTFSSTDLSHNNDAGQDAMARYLTGYYFAKKGWL